MGIILDSNVIICGEKGTYDLRGWLSSNAGYDVQIAAITVAELWHGVERAEGKRRLRREAYLHNILRKVPVVPYTEGIALEHARVWADLERLGKMTGYYDLIVGATALYTGSKLATFNRRHFENIEGLELISL